MDNAKYTLAVPSKEKFNALLKEILNDVKPSKKENDEIRFAINEVMGRLMKITPKDVEILLAGSVARNTQIKGNSDIDIFLLFPRKMKEKEIEKKGLGIGKKIVNKKKNESFIVKYAEHPYTRLFLSDININVDIVPAYKIKDATERGTAVDRTQLHNEFINANLTEKQRDEVRVLKAFLKAHNIYGAEAKTEGFSGYLCELLTYHYGSFLNVVTNIANLKLPIILDYSKYKKLDNRDPKDLVKFFDKNFVVVDPTDSNRNVSANVSHESLFRFVIISRNLLKNPDKIMFYGIGHPNIYSEKRLIGINNMLGTNLYVLNFEVPDIADDIIWQQLKKTKMRLHDMLVANGFYPIVSLQNTENKSATIGFFIENTNITATKITGPGLEMGDAVEKFIKSHKNSMFISIEKDRIYSIEKAKYPNPEELIRAFLNNKSVNLPSYINPKKSELYLNKIPGKYAKLIYIAYVNKFSI